MSPTARHRRTATPTPTGIARTPATRPTTVPQASTTRLRSPSSPPTALSAARVPASRRWATVATGTASATSSASTARRNRGTGHRVSAAGSSPGGLSASMPTGCISEGEEAPAARAREVTRKPWALRSRTSARPRPPDPRTYHVVEARSHTRDRSTARVPAPTTTAEESPVDPTILAVAPAVSLRRPASMRTRTSRRSPTCVPVRAITDRGTRASPAPRRPRRGTSMLGTRVSPVCMTTAPVSRPTPMAGRCAVGTVLRIAP